MDLDYNTQLEPLLIKEYGRNVQRMINHAINIADREERNAAAFEIIKVMELINPDPKKGADHEHKLWDHMHIIAQNNLDVDAPYDKPEADKPIDKVASKPGYPKGKIKYRHYGSIVEEMIAVAKNEADPEVKQRMENYLAAYMKLAYKEWNEQKLSDEVIIQNLSDMSGGAIEIDQVIDITESVQTTANNNLVSKQTMGGPKRNLPLKKRKKKRR